MSRKAKFKYLLMPFAFSFLSCFHNSPDLIFCTSRGCCLVAGSKLWIALALDNLPFFNLYNVHVQLGEGD